MNIDLERLKIHWRGEYSATITYKEGEIVFYKGSCFAAKAENIAIEPIEGRDWELVAPTPISLREKGDLLFHNGNEVIRLPIGEEEQALQLVSGVPSWSSDEVIGFLPGEEINSNLPNLVYKLAKMGLNASHYYRTYLMADGTIKAAGYSFSYRNGDLDDADIFVPSRVNADTAEVRFKEIFSGYESNYAIDMEDNVWSWGSNSDGQLGHGNTTNIATAKRIEYFVTNSINIKNIVTGNRTNNALGLCAFFLTTDGKIYGCGENNSGQLGDGTTTTRTTPVRCGTLENMKDIFVSVASIAVYAIDLNGTLWVWGDNEEGQLGIGNTSNQTTPIQVTSFSNVKKIASANGRENSTGNRGWAIAIQEDGTLWSTGFNESGNLGLGNTTNKNSWTRVTTSVTFKDIACSIGHVPSAAGISTDDKLYVWGGNDNGQLGDGTTTSKNVPTLSIYSNANNVTKILFGGESYSFSTRNFSFSSLYFQAGNMIYAAGYSANGNLGTRSTTSINSSFAPVVGISGMIKDWTVYGVEDIYGLSVLMIDGSIYAGGNNSFGLTGTHRTSSATVTNLKRVIF